VYASEQGTDRVEIWSENGANSTRILYGNLNNPGAIFVSINGDTYVDNGGNGQVVKWTVNGSSSIVVMNVTVQCLGLFIDINDTLYCALDNQHTVVKMSLIGAAYPPTTVAGNGTSGSDANLLYHPNGIFVDSNFTLYVADSFNARIQRFWVGQSNATTVAGNGASGSFSLSLPTGIFVDDDGYLFIVDAWNSRIIASGPYGFRCIAGCSSSSGNSSTQFNNPRTLGFDSYGNLYVSDLDNNRIQKFILMTNSCGKFKK
jgi:hypothetical protein